MRFLVGAALIVLARRVLKPHDRASLDLVMNLGAEASIQRVQELIDKVNRGEP